MVSVCALHEESCAVKIPLVAVSPVIVLPLKVPPLEKTLSVPLAESVSVWFPTGFP